MLFQCCQYFALHYFYLVRVYCVYVKVFTNVGVYLIYICSYFVIYIYIYLQTLWLRSVILHWHSVTSLHPDHLDIVFLMLVHCTYLLITPFAHNLYASSLNICLFSKKLSYIFHINVPLISFVPKQTLTSSLPSEDKGFYSSLNISLMDNLALYWSSRETHTISLALLQFQ